MTNKVREIGLPKSRIDLWIEKYREAEREGRPTDFLTAPFGTVYTNWAVNRGRNSFIFICQDITDLKNMEEDLRQQKNMLEDTVKERTKELEQALRVKSEFLAIMSHGKHLLEICNFCEKFEHLCLE